MPSWEISSFYCLVCFFPFFPELFRFCTVGDLPKVKELLEEASAVTINKLYQGGSTLLYKYVTKLIYSLLFIYKVRQSCIIPVKLFVKHFC